MIGALFLAGCPQLSERREHVADFGASKIYVTQKIGDGSAFGPGQFGGLGVEIVTNGEWKDERWNRSVSTETYKLSLDTRGLNLFVHMTAEEPTWDDALNPGDWAELFNINSRANAFHRDVYAFDHQFRFVVSPDAPDPAAGGNPPAKTPLTNTITAKGTLKAWAAYTAAGDGANLELLDGVNIAGVAALDDGRAARVTLAAPIDGTPAVEAHYNHRSRANPYRIIVTREVTGTYVDIEHYDVAHQELRDQRAQDHGVTYVFVYGRQD